MSGQVKSHHGHSGVQRSHAKALQSENSCPKRPRPRPRTICTMLLGEPTIRNFKHILRKDLIPNCPVTVEDVNIPDRAFGPTQKPKPVVSKIASIPKALAKYTKILSCLCCTNMMFLNKIPFLTSIAKTIRYTSAIIMRKQTHAAYCEAIPCQRDC